MLHFPLCLFPPLWLVMDGRDFVFVSLPRIWFKVIAHSGVCWTNEWGTLPTANLSLLIFEMDILKFLSEGNCEDWMKSALWPTLLTIMCAPLLIPHKALCSGLLGNRRGQLGNNPLALGSLWSLWASVLSLIMYMRKLWNTFYCYLSFMKEEVTWEN